MKEYVINEYLSLKFVEGVSYIFVKDILFRACKFLLMNVPINESYPNEIINSIDEAADKLDRSLEVLSDQGIQIISPETEFWGHCSNLQAWYEHGYDSCLLHSNLSFPLLKELCKVGDPQANRVFKEEIAKRLSSNYIPVVHYLLLENYLDFLTKEELMTVFADLNHQDEELLNYIGTYFYKANHYEEAFKVYTNIYKKNNANREAILSLGNIYLSRKDNHNAVKMYEKALEIEFTFEFFVVKLCLMYLEQGEKEKVLQLLTYALKKDLYNRYFWDLCLCDELIEDHRFLNLISQYLQNLSKESISEIFPEFKYIPEKVYSFILNELRNSKLCVFLGKDIIIASNDFLDLSRMKIRNRICTDNFAQAFDFRKEQFKNT